MFKSGPSKGFTLIEVMIALAVSSIIIFGLTKLYSATLKSYSLQEQLTEMNQNAKFAMKEISDILMQAGADCMAINSDSTDRDTIVKLTGAGPNYNEFTIKLNPRGGVYIIPSNITLNTSAGAWLTVDDASKFKSAAKLGRIARPGATAADTIVKVYNLDDVDVPNHRLSISGGASTTDLFVAQDVVYSFVNNRYYLNGTDLCLNVDTNVLAENIDVFQVTFFNKGGDSVLVSTPPWLTMRSARLILESTTSIPDYRYSGDGKRRLKLSYAFRLKNKM